MKLQNCNFMEKFRLISCQASFILAIKIVILDKSFILIIFSYGILSIPLLGRCICKIKRYLSN